VVPAPFRERLKNQAMASSVLGLRVEDQAVTVLKLLASAGYPVVPIKGMARRALAQRYPYLDARMTSDVDLLMPEATIQEAYQFLQGHGYHPKSGPRATEHHHLPGLWNEQRISVELHNSTSIRVPPPVAWSRATEGAQDIEWAGIRVQVPSATELAWAAVTHAINGSHVRGYRLQHFLEVAALAAVPGEVDWEEIMRRTGGRETFDEATDATHPSAICRQWLDGALQLVSPGLRPPARSPDPLDLPLLLGWRLRVLKSRVHLGISMTERMIEEGPRALLGFPLQGAPSGTSRLQRLRRRAAGRVSRLTFRSWQLTRGAG
jgi:hypothetical protein